MSFKIQIEVEVNSIHEIYKILERIGPGNYVVYTPAIRYEQRIHPKSTAFSPIAAKLSHQLGEQSLAVACGVTGETVRRWCCGTQAPKRFSRAYSTVMNLAKSMHIVD